MNICGSIKSEYLGVPTRAIRVGLNTNVCMIRVAETVSVNVVCMIRAAEKVEKTVNVCMIRAAEKVEKTVNVCLLGLLRRLRRLLMFVC